MEQLRLFGEDAGLWPDRGTSHATDVVAAHAYVDAVKARRCCRRCGEDEPGRLLFVKRTPAPSWWTSVARLVALGAGRGQLGDAIRVCDVWCRRCWLAQTWAPTSDQVRRQAYCRLRLARRAAVDVVAKAATTTGGGRKRRRGLEAKAG